MWIIHFLLMIMTSTFAGGYLFVLRIGNILKCNLAARLHYTVPNWTIPKSGADQNSEAYLLLKGAASLRIMPLAILKPRALQYFRH
jgi:hypothetical protein